MSEFDTDGLADRLRATMRLRQLSARAWAARAGYSENLVNTFLSRLRRGEIQTLKNHVLYDLAVAAEINPLWLMVGKGSPNLPTQVDGTSPWRAMVITMALSEGISPAVAHQLEAFTPPADDDGPFYWFELLSKIQSGERTQPEPGQQQLRQLASGHPKDL